MQARDLEADLAICEAATPTRWEHGYSYGAVPYTVVSRGAEDKTIARVFRPGDARFIAEAREGWPYAIRRALEAEAEVDRLRHEIEILREQLEQRGCCT